jgi:hypothetical protein
MLKAAIHVLSPAPFSFIKLYYGTVYCGTFAHLYAKALYYVPESTKSCTVAG